jgi:ribose-phosphate pyrophosphokinase
MEALPILAKHFINYGFHPEDTVVVSPDVGGVKRARGLARWLHTPLAIIDKRRPKANESEVMNIIGDVQGKKAIIIDDMIDTAGTICNAAKALKEKGAVEVYACAIHAIFSGPAIERLKNAPLNKIVVTDSIELPEEKIFDKLRILTTSKMFAETIKRIYWNEAISDLFEMPSEERETKVNE